MKIVPPPPMAPPTLRQLFERRCFLLGIDRDRWPRLWTDELARRTGRGG